MVDIKLIERLLFRQQSLKRELEARKISSLKELEGSLMLQKGVEKILQEMIEICIDAGKHIISDEGFPLPENNRDVFRILNQNGVISGKMTRSLQEMVGFRNIIIHLYEKVEVPVIYSILKKHLGDFDAFAVEIRYFLKKR